MATSSHSQALGSITFSTGFFAEILDISHGGIKRDKIDCTNMATATTTTSTTLGNKIAIPSAYVDPGELTVEIQFNPDTKPPIDSAAASCTVKLGNAATQAQWAGSAFLTEFSYKAPLDGTVMRASCKVVFTGVITITAGV